MRCNSCARYRHTHVRFVAHGKIVMGSEGKYSGSVHGKNLVKLLRAIDLLSRPSGASIKELQDGLGISRRSVYRMFDILESLIFPLYDQDRPGEKEKRWGLQEDFLHRMPNLRIPDMKLTPREMLVLYFLLSQDRIFANTAVGDHLFSIRQKLAAIMPTDYLTAAQSDRIESLFASGSLHPKSYEGMETSIDTLLEAVVERKVCKITYEALSHGKRRSYEIHRLRLFEHHGGLYVFVTVPAKDAVRILAVDRLKRITLTDETFDEPSDFDPESVLGHTFDLTLGDPVTAVIHFSPEGARRVKNRRWSATQNFEEHSDGSVTLTMETSGRDDVVRWVLSFGHNAELLKPIGLRSALEEELVQLLKTYQST
jgi:predicted DNA-binding transcriptional regulator YafY